MPLFEYSCRACGKRFTFLRGVVSGGSEEARCPRCNSQDLQKLMSRFARGRSDDERMDAVAEKMETRNLDDASSLRQFAREMGSEISAESGVDMRDEMEAMIEAEARGESLDDFDGENGGFSGGASSNADDGKIY
jgi:putative FmdB family regulatory protein